MPRPRISKRFYVARWSAAGAAFGALMMFVAWRVAIADSGGMSFEELHTAHPIMWLIDLMPTILGLVGAFIGILHLRLAEARARTEETARQIAGAWTAELHEANMELMKTVEERQRFYAAFSHEMRTPLASIVGFSELVDGADVRPPEVGGYVAEIYGSARTLLEIVNDLLDAAKLELGWCVSPYRFCRGQRYRGRGGAPALSLSATERPGDQDKLRGFGCGPSRCWSAAADPDESGLQRHQVLGPRADHFPLSENQ